MEPIPTSSPAVSDYVVLTQAVYEGSLRCRATHVDSGASFVTVAPRDNQGDGSSFSPTDLVGASMATCMLTIMAIAARRDGIEIEGASMEVAKQMTAAPPRRIGRLTCTVTVPANLSDEQIEKLRRAAETCPVRRSLHPEAQVELEFKRAGV